MLVALNKKWSFPLRISSVNAKSFIYWRNSSFFVFCGFITSHVATQTGATIVTGWRSLVTWSISRILPSKGISTFVSKLLSPTFVCFIFTLPIHDCPGRKVSHCKLSLLSTVVVRRPKSGPATYVLYSAVNVDL